MDHGGYGGGNLHEELEATKLGRNSVGIKCCENGQEMTRVDLTEVA